MKCNTKGQLTLSLLLIFSSVSAIANEVALHGFIRTVLDISDSEAPYLETIDENGDFGSSFACLNYGTSLNAEWTVAGQFFFKAKEGEVELDWALATFEPSDTLAFRFGRQKFPLGLVTESIDIGITYPCVQPPAEFYQLESGEESPNIVIESFDGVSAVFTRGDEWKYTFQPFIGQNNYTFDAGTNQRKMLGLKSEVSNSMVTLQAGYMHSKFTVAEAGAPQNADKNTFTLGSKIELDNLLVMVEYAETEVDDFDDYDSTSSYATVGYSSGKILPSFTIANVEAQNGALDQESIALDLAYRYDPSIVYKNASSAKSMGHFRFG